jgi:RHS repeat-associated protein
LAARKFYYDNNQARYLDRDVDPNTWTPLASWNWADYSVGAAASATGPEPDADFTFVPNGAATEQRHYLAAFGVRAQQTVTSGARRYLHGDLIRSTMLTTNEGATAVSAMSYTAFGEPTGDPSAWGTRYQYAGGWGYESGLLTLAGANPNLRPIALLHVGARWYQPAVGRFMQRDPIGIRGGMHVYAYVRNGPTYAIDPTGRWDDFMWERYYQRRDRMTEQERQGLDTAAGVVAVGATAGAVCIALAPQILGAAAAAASEAAPWIRPPRWCWPPFPPWDKAIPPQPIIPPIGPPIIPN